MVEPISLSDHGESALELVLVIFGLFLVLSLSPGYRPPIIALWMKVFFNHNICS